MFSGKEEHVLRTLIILFLVFCTGVLLFIDNSFEFQRHSRYSLWLEGGCIFHIQRYKYRPDLSHVFLFMFTGDVEANNTYNSHLAKLYTSMSIFSH